MTFLTNVYTFRIPSTHAHMPRRCLDLSPFTTWREGSGEGGGAKGEGGEGGGARGGGARVAVARAEELRVVARAA